VRYLEKKFSVGGAGSDDYAANYDRIFAKCNCPNWWMTPGAREAMEKISLYKSEYLSHHPDCPKYLPRA
jgi:hypothetical protein